MEHQEAIIVFENLRQATDTIGQYAPVKAVASSKARPFAQSNATGLIRDCADRHAAGELGKAAAKRAMAMLNA